jgi:Protein of unknown function (DUF433)
LRRFRQYIPRLAEGGINRSQRLAFDLDLKTLFEDYPDLTEADIKACIAYAKEISNLSKILRRNAILPRSF